MAENPLSVDVIFPTKGPTFNVARGRSPEVIIDMFDKPEMLTFFHDPILGEVRICPKDHLEYHQTAVQVGSDMLTERGLSAGDFRQFSYAEALRFHLGVQERLDQLGANDPRQPLFRVADKFAQKRAMLEVTWGTNILEIGQNAAHTVRSFDHPEALTVHQDYLGRFFVFRKEDLEGHQRRDEYTIDFFRQRDIDITNPDDRQRVTQKMLNDYQKGMQALNAELENQ